MKLPVVIIAHMSASRGGEYRCHLGGWGVDDLGKYGSLWVRDLDLGVGSAASAEEVLRALQGALDRTLRPA